MPRQTIEAMVSPEGHGMRLDVFCASMEGAPTRSAVARLIESGQVTINGTLATSKSERLVMGDRVALELEVDVDSGGPLRPNSEIRLDVRFEDEYLLVISKQAGLVCHPSPGHIDDTLANALVARCGYDHLGMLQGEDRPGIVHRLDGDTSGLMVAAKDDLTQNALQNLIRMRVLERRYVTLVHGFVAADKGTITTGIGRSTRDRLRMAVTDDPCAREAITTFRVLERFEANVRDDGFTLMECHLYTGRTHQIRVHMRHIGHPVVGDQLYGIGARKGKARSRDLDLTRQFLHSYFIAFDHPWTHEHIELSDDLPADLATVMRDIEGRSMGRTPKGQVLCPDLW